MNNVSGVWTHTEYSDENDFVIYYLHGGAFILFDSDVLAGTIEGYSRGLNASVFSVDYRLSPEYAFPLGLSDVVNGYKYLLKNYSSSKIILLGESVGGNLVISLLLALRDAELPKPYKAIAVSGVYNLLLNYPSLKENQYKDLINYGIDGPKFRETMAPIGYYPLSLFDSMKRYPLISPYYGDLRKLPPIQFWAARDEILRDDTVLMYRKCLVEGVYAELNIGDHNIHAWTLFPYLNETKQAYEKMHEFINQGV